MNSCCLSPITIVVCDYLWPETESTRECGLPDWPDMKTTIIKATLQRMWRSRHSRSLRSPARSFNVRIDVPVNHLLQPCTIHAMQAASLITILLIQLNKLKNSYNSRINHNKIFRLTLSLEFKWYVFYSEGIFPMLSIVFADERRFPFVSILKSGLFIPFRLAGPKWSTKITLCLGISVSSIPNNHQQVVKNNSNESSATYRHARGKLWIWTGEQEEVHWNTMLPDRESTVLQIPARLKLVPIINNSFLSRESATYLFYDNSPISFQTFLPLCKH